jgi:hypothetical protein
MLSQLVELYADGGIWMQAILLADLSGIATVVLQFVTPRARWNALYLTLGVLAGLVVLGLLGTVVGMIQASTAIAATIRSAIATTG